MFKNTVFLLAFTFLGAVTIGCGKDDDTKDVAELESDVTKAQEEAKDLEQKAQQAQAEAKANPTEQNKSASVKAEVALDQGQQTALQAQQDLDKAQFSGGSIKGPPVDYNNFCNSVNYSAYNNLFHYVALYKPAKDRVKVANCLLERGFDVNAIRYIHAPGVFPSSVNALGYDTALYYLTVNPKEDRLEFFEWLLKNGADPNKLGKFLSAITSPAGNIAKDSDEPLAIKFLQILLKYGADINIVVDGKGSKGGFDVAPLFQAVVKNRLETVRFLISKGADERITDQIGATPLDYAKTLGHTEIVQYLQSLGSTK